MLLSVDGPKPKYYIWFNVSRFKNLVVEELHCVICAITVAYNGVSRGMLLMVPNPNIIFGSISVQCVNCQDVKVKVLLWRNTPSVICAILTGSIQWCQPWDAIDGPKPT